MLAHRIHNVFQILTLASGVHIMISNLAAVVSIFTLSAYQEVFHIHFNWLMYLPWVPDYSRIHSLLWERNSLKLGWDVTWTAAGNIAVSDYETHTVRLWNTAGQEIRNTSTQGVKLKHPYGITYHTTWHGGVIVVVHDKCKLIALHPVDLHQMDTIDLNHHCDCLWGITTVTRLMATSGRILTQATNSSMSYQVESGVLVVSLTGQIRHKWQLPTEYPPKYITSTSDGKLLISVSNVHRVYKTTLRGKIVWQTDYNMTPQPRGMIQDYTTSNILMSCYGYTGHHVRVLWMSAGGDLLQHPLPSPSGVTWDYGLLSLSLRGQYLAVLYLHRLQLYSLYILQHKWYQRDMLHR